MKDLNNNTSDNATNKLQTWLEDHTDPNKNPWSDDNWRHYKDIIDNISDCDSDDDHVTVDPTCDREDEADCVVELGGRNEAGDLEGNVHLKWSNGDTFKGMFVNGRRQGWGVVSSPGHDIMALTGDWSNGYLEGRGRLVCQLGVNLS